MVFPISESTPVVRLDQRHYSPSTKADLDRWIQDGGPASVGSAVDITSVVSIVALKEDARALLGRFHQWRLADRLGL